MGAKEDDFPLTVIRGMEVEKWLPYFFLFHEVLFPNMFSYNIDSDTAKNREEVFMEGPLEPNMGPSLADVLLCTFESTNAGFPSFPLRKLLSWE